MMNNKNWLEIVLSILVLLGCIGILDDVSELKATNAELVDAGNDAEWALRRCNDFLRLVFAENDTFVGQHEHGELNDFVIEAGNKLRQALAKARGES